MNLVIVESPAKAKTINKYLGKDFTVIASFGHIRDLPSKNGSVLPEQDFAMKYELSAKAGKYVNEIAKAAAKSDIIYLATDPDREGESISWHIAEILKEQKIVKSDAIFKRVAFNEITKKAVLQAVANPRNIDISLVNAQQARRALDYLVGFTLSPLLWRKLPGCKSAGRVQSVALRLICEREDEIERFKTEEYWDITLGLRNSSKEAFTARLTHVNKEKLEKFSITNESQAKTIVDALEKESFSVAVIEKKQQRRTPAAPFITSSLQQEAARKLGFSAKKTMQIAQKLYEGIDINGESVGLITYMRTDGVTLSTDAIEEIRKAIKDSFGDKYLPASPRAYKSKAKNAQEAHEAIRPTDIKLMAASLKDKLDKDFLKLYELIWKRTVACQMENALIDIVVVELDSKSKEFSARATGSTLAFDGFYKLYQEGIDDQLEEDRKTLPVLKEGELVVTEFIKPAQHFTEPLPRYSEASLVKKMEELGIGRPSTYASILSVLQERNYVNLIKKRFIPEELGRLVTSFLVGFFKKYVEYDFTAELETDLDEIAEGKREWKKLLHDFWDGFNGNIAKVSEQKTADVIKYVEESLEHHLFILNNNSRLCPSCSNGTLNLKLGKFGAFLGCSNYPDCTFKKQISSITTANGEMVDNSEGANDGNKLLGQNKDNIDVYLKKGPYGWYVQAGEQISKTEKPKRAALPSAILPQDVNIDTASKLLSLPLNIGIHPESNKEIILGIGKFGPYVKHDGKFISIPKKLDPFSITIEDAVGIISKSKK